MKRYLTDLEIGALKAAINTHLKEGEFPTLVADYSGSFPNDPKKALKYYTSSDYERLLKVIDPDDVDFSFADALHAFILPMGDDIYDYLNMRDAVKIFKDRLDDRIEEMEREQKGQALLDHFKKEIMFRDEEEIDIYPYTDDIIKASKRCLSGRITTEPYLEEEAVVGMGVVFKEKEFIAVWNYPMERFELEALIFDDLELLDKVEVSDLDSQLVHIGMMKSFAADGVINKLKPILQLIQDDDDASIDTYTNFIISLLESQIHQARRV